MMITRRFRLASPLARLIEREKKGVCIEEGYFSSSSDQVVYVRTKDEMAELIVLKDEADHTAEQSAGISQAHAEALLSVAVNRVRYTRFPIHLGSREARIIRFAEPKLLDLIAVTFETEEQAQRFHPLPWFGSEISTESSHLDGPIVFTDLGSAFETEVIGLALNSLLDTLDGNLPSGANQPIELDKVTPDKELPMFGPHPAAVVEAPQEAIVLKLEEVVLEALSSASKTTGAQPAV